jgi:hypothetical protein
MNHGVNWNLIDATINGTSTRAIEMDHIFGNHQGLELFLKHAGNAGLGCCDLGHFTFVWDLYLDTNQNQLQCLWQGNADNANDGELFLDCRDGGFYVGGAGYVGEGHWPLGQWFRLVHAVNFAGAENALYVDGERVELLSNGVDWLYANGSGLPIWLLTDDGPDVDVSIVHCAAAAIADRVLSAEDVALLGGPNAAGIFIDSAPPCPGDFSGDGVVSVEDVLEVIGGWGTKYQIEDLLLVLAQYGNAC